MSDQEISKDNPPYGHDLTRPPLRHTHNTRLQAKTAGKDEVTSSDTDVRESSHGESDDHSFDETDSGRSRRNKRIKQHKRKESTRSDKSQESDYKSRTVKPDARESTQKEKGSIKEGKESIKKGKESIQIEHNHTLHYCIFAIIIVLIGIGVYLVNPLYTIVPEMSKSSMQTPTLEEQVQSFTSSLDKIKSKFPSQSSRFWQVIKAAIISNLKLESPLYPAIVFIASHESNDVTKCLTKELVAITQKAYQTDHTVEISADSLQKNSKDGAAKLELDTKYQEGFDNGGRVSLLNNLEKTPSEIGVMLHSYCDNENAPYKNVVFFFEMNLSDDVDISEGVIEKQLAKAWSDLEADQYEAVWSRIGNNVAIVSKELESATLQC